MLEVGINIKKKGRDDTILTAKQKLVRHFQTVYTMQEFKLPEEKLMPSYAPFGYNKQNL